MQKNACVNTVKSVPSDSCPIECIRDCELIPLMCRVGFGPQPTLANDSFAPIKMLLASKMVKIDPKK